MGVDIFFYFICFGFGLFFFFFCFLCLVIDYLVFDVILFIGLFLYLIWFVLFLLFF